ncbi:MAG: cytidylate kinase-like family protein [Parabacteroides sp.]|nr:cytidylate kinase-like family protein [Parabacteroides sp.]
MENNRRVITIGRQFGSGGREIGKKLAESLDIPFYDRELITLASKESGLCPEFFEKADERASHSLSYAFTLGFPFFGNVSPYNDYLSNDTLFKIQSDTIRKIASEGSCVIVGRCADYILREDKRCVNVFIHSSLEKRMERVVQRNGVTVEEAKVLIEKTDKSRAGFYNYYSNKTWGVAATYHLSVDSCSLGIEGTVEFIRSFVEQKLG